MAVRDDFTAGEVLAAADLNDTFASKPPFAYGTATPSTTVEGFIFYDENVTPPAPKFWDGAAFQSFGGGKILQIVRATDATFRTTTSTSFVDASNSVTITPKKATSSILLIAIVATQSASNDYVKIQITNNSNVAISGAERMDCGTTGGGIDLSVGTLIGYDSPNTTSATTYKLRFATGTAGTARISNNLSTGQIYAIEVSA